jgi:hypothetical protein
MPSTRRYIQMSYFVPLLLLDVSSPSKFTAAEISELENAGVFIYRSAASYGSDK